MRGAKIETATTAPEPQQSEQQHHRLSVAPPPGFLARWQGRDADATPTAAVACPPIGSRDDRSTSRLHHVQVQDEIVHYRRFAIEAAQQFHGTTADDALAE